MKPAKLAESMKIKGSRVGHLLVSLEESTYRDASMPLYLIVIHRAALEQGHANTWGTQGRLVSIKTTDAVLAVAEQAKTGGSPTI